MIKSIKDITIESNIKVEVSDGVIDAKVIAVKAS
jgi:exodeoxyribonuclease VII large subunit